MRALAGGRLVVVESDPTTSDCAASDFETRGLCGGRARRDDRGPWAEALMGTPARAAAGRRPAQLASDPFVLGLATDHGGLRIADPVRLYLDCRVAGERALEAADAIRGEMDW